MARVISAFGMDVLLLAQRLQQVGPGETVSYSVLSKAIGRGVRSDEPGYGALTAARRRVQRDYRLVFGPVRGVGLKCLTDEEIVESGQYEVDGTRRRADRVMNRLGCVKDYDSLEPESKVNHNTMASVFAFIGNVLQAAPMKRLKGHVAKAKAQLPLAKTLLALGGTIELRR